MLLLVDTSPLPGWMQSGDITTMKSSCAALAVSICLIPFLSCSRDDYRKSVPGIWEWNGDRCDAVGRCEREIITDEGGRMEFTGDGRYRGRAADSTYVIRKNGIYLATGKDSHENLLAEIVWIRGGTMLLKSGGTTRRYARISTPR